MGLGSYLTQHHEDRLLARLLQAQLWLAGLGGATILALSFADMLTANFELLCHGWTVLLGALVGYQLPLAVRIVEEDGSLREILARVLFVDYLGALAGSLALPWYLMPRLGFAKTSLFVGGVCLASAGLLGWVFRKELAEAHEEKGGFLRLDRAWWRWGAMGLVWIGLGAGWEVERDVSRSFVAPSKPWLTTRVSQTLSLSRAALYPLQGKLFSDPQSPAPIQHPG